MLLPNSQFIPPSHLSPLVTISLFSMSMSLCFVNQFIYVFIFLVPHISEI